MTKLKNLWIDFFESFVRSSGNQLEGLTDDLYEECLNELREELEKEKDNSRALNFMEFKVISGQGLSSNELRLLEEYKKSISVF